MNILPHDRTHRKFGERGLAAGPACGEARAHPILIINYVILQRHVFQILFNGPRMVWRCGAKMVKIEVPIR